MDREHSFGKALRLVRLAKGMSQDDFSDMTTQAHMSRLEREVRIPTLAKVDQLAQWLDVDPITLLALAYLKAKEGELAQGRLEKVCQEVQEFLGEREPQPTSLPVVQTLN